MGETSENPDVRQLADRNLPSFPFPASGKQDFRVYFAPAVHSSIAGHAAEDTSVEICGVLVGRWGKDTEGPFVMISEWIRSDSADARSEQVTFTHEAWAEISEEMDTRFADLNIVGWYHSHPDFGIFLSQRDCFIQEHFFSNPGQVAFVVDPVRKTEGVFVWKNGRPTECSLYWVGDRIVLPQNAGHAEAPPPDGSRALTRPPEPAAAETPGPAIGMLSRLPMYLAVFVIGYMLASLPSSWQRQRIVEGTVAHFGVWKVLRPGLRENLDRAQSDLGEVSDAVARLGGEQVASAGAEGSATKGEWAEVRTRLVRARRRLSLIEQTYCLDPVEAAALSKFLTDTLGGAAAAAKPRSDEGRPDDRAAGRETQEQAAPAAGKKGTDDAEPERPPGGTADPEDAERTSSPDVTPQAERS